MSSFSYGHGEIVDHQQHRFAFALMFLAVALATLTLVVTTHRVTDPNAGRTPAEPSAPVCKNVGRMYGLLEDQAAIRYCIYE